MQRTHVRLATAVGYLVVLSCAEDSTAPARKTMALKAPAFDIVVFDGTLSTTLLNPAATLTLPTYSDPIILRLEIHRTIQITSDKNGQYSTFTGPLDGHGIHIFGVYDQCFANVIFQWKDAAMTVAPL
jgi:hypothetical protein